MKTYYTVWCVVIFVCFATLPCGAQDHLVISRPEKTSEVHGLLGERILTEAYARLGIDVEFRELPIERALVMANDGDTDGAFLRVAGLEQRYPNLVMVPFLIKYMEVMVFTKEAEFAVEGWQSLAPYTIGIARGFKLAEANTEGMDVEAVTTVEQAFLNLAPSADFFACYPISGNNPSCKGAVIP